MSITPGMAKRIAAAAASDKHDDGAQLPTFTVAGLPAAAANDGRVVRVSNGAAGQPCLAVSNGANWLRVVLGAAVATV